MSGEGDTRAVPGDLDMKTLQHALQVKRRALTLLHAEREKERELRESLEAQLIEANLEIVASWDRRKEMSRMLGELQAQLALTKGQLVDITAKLKVQTQGRQKAEQRIASLEQVISQREQVIANREQAIAKRDEALTKRELAISSRDEKIKNRENQIKQLKDDLRTRYEELAAIQRHIVDSSISGKAKRAARKAKGLVRKGFGG